MAGEVGMKKERIPVSDRPIPVRDWLLVLLALALAAYVGLPLLMS